MPLPVHIPPTPPVLIPWRGMSRCFSQVYWFQVSILWFYKEQKEMQVSLLKGPIFLPSSQPRSVQLSSLKFLESFKALARGFYLLIASRFAATQGSSLCHYCGEHSTYRPPVWVQNCLGVHETAMKQPHSRALHLSHTIAQGFHLCLGRTAHAISDLPYISPWLTLHDTTTMLSLTTALPSPGPPAYCLFLKPG